VAQRVRYDETDGVLHAFTDVAVKGSKFFVEPATVPADAAAVVVETELDLAEDARVEGAVFELAASPGGPTTIDSVAQVRPANARTAGSTACTVDFGRLVTVGGLRLRTASGSAPAISAVHRWTGTDWACLSGGTAFAETAAERLLVESTSETDADELAAGLVSAWEVELPAVPGGLELLVDGVSVWFERQGSSSGTIPPAVTGGGVAYAVDRTEVVREAFARAVASEGRRKVAVALRAAVPGDLRLVSDLTVLRVHTVAFPPDGLATTRQLPAEGPATFDVTPPAGAAEVREVALTVRGSFGPERVQPAAGPDLEPEVVLALEPGRPVLVGLPAVLAQRLGELTGVRLRLAPVVGGSGGELAGGLLADTGGRPGAALPGAELTPITVSGGPTGGDWFTLPLASPVRLPPAPAPAPGQPPEPAPAEAPGTRVAAWLELQLSYGALECALTRADVVDPVAPGAPLLRRLPGGGMTPLSVLPDFGELRAAVRLVGRPDRDRPVPAVTLEVERGGASIGADPTGDDLAVTLGLTEPVHPADGPVLLTALAAAPGSLTVDTVRVAYTEGAAS
jgi:hypothetical protein